ncbi:MAG: hypothetical protein EAX95_07875 [Candidatus Thorarchaeota archaeon]|nr:hypothetical protein [Candidatus Thorarchaeota archaeon]
MDFSALKDEMARTPWESPEREEKPLQPVNLAPLKGVIEADAVRSRILKVLIEDGTWVTTADLLKEARKERPILGAVSIGTILNGLNNLVASRLILSRTSSAAGTDWAEWRINPDLLRPTRKLLQMLTRPKFEKMLLEKSQSDDLDTPKA